MCALSDGTMPTAAKCDKRALEKHVVAHDNNTNSIYVAYAIPVSRDFGGRGEGSQ